MLFEVRDLSVEYIGPKKRKKIVSNVNLSLGYKETLAVVGESGSGKSMITNAIMGLMPSKFMHTRGRILFRQEDLLKKSEHEMQSIRGQRIGMVFQNTMSSLNPTMKIGDQVSEGVKFHRKLGDKAGEYLAKNLLDMVKIRDVDRVMNQYPHQLSGGMRQRVMIAIAISCDPDILIADEPTTSLDVVTQGEILKLIMELKNSSEMSIILISHDISVVAGVADRVAVIYGGRVMEEGITSKILGKPNNPYTKFLLNSLPSINKGEGSLNGTGYLTASAKGCPFSTRCPDSKEICNVKAPGAFRVEKDHSSNCWLNDKGEK